MSVSFIMSFMKPHALLNGWSYLGDIGEYELRILDLTLQRHRDINDTGLAVAPLPRRRVVGGDQLAVPRLLDDESSAPLLAVNDPLHHLVHQPHLFR